MWINSKIEKCLGELTIVIHTVVESTAALISFHERETSHELGFIQFMEEINAEWYNSWLYIYIYIYISI